MINVGDHKFQSSKKVGDFLIFGGNPCRDYQVFLNVTAVFNTTPICVQVCKVSSEAMHTVLRYEGSNMTQNNDVGEFECPLGLTKPSDAAVASKILTSLQ